MAHGFLPQFSKNSGKNFQLFKKDPLLFFIMVYLKKKFWKNFWNYMPVVPDN